MPDEKTTSHPPPSPDLPSPTNPRDTHASSIFPYSTARPPTNYSDQSWVPPKPAPPVPPRHPSRALSNENPFGGIEEDEEELEDSRDTPLYARSDWEDEERTATGTAWSRSSYAGMTTGAPKSAFAGLDEIVEEDDEIFEEAQIMPPAVVPPQEQGLAPRQPPSAGSSMRKRFTGHTDRSTLPSVLDLEHLTATAPAVDPFADPKNTNRARRRTSYLPEPTPDPEAFRASPDLLTPAAHQRLGRMSVAPARYTLPAARKDSDTSVPVPKSQSPVLTAPFSGWSKVRRLFQAYRPFVNAELTLISAILLIMSRQNGSGLSNVVAVAAGAFSVDAANGAEVGLGAVGWCERGKSKQVGLTSTSAILMKGQSDMQSVLTR